MQPLSKNELQQDIMDLHEVEFAYTNQLLQAYFKYTLEHDRFNENEFHVWACNVFFAGECDSFEPLEYHMEDDAVFDLPEGLIVREDAVTETDWYYVNFLTSYKLATIAWKLFHK